MASGNASGHLSFERESSACVDAEQIDEAGHHRLQGGLQRPRRIDDEQPAAVHAEAIAGRRSDAQRHMQPPTGRQLAQS